MARSDFDMITAGQGSNRTPPGQADIPPWSAAAHAWDSSDELPQPRTPVALVQCLVDEARGWPMQGMRYRYFYLNTLENPYVIDIEMCNGLKLPSPGNSYFGWPLPQALPLRPIWRSFAGNTLFYGAILWLLTLGPFTARRMIRRQRGHCINCGYDLRGDFSAGCPECGWHREEAE